MTKTRALAFAAVVLLGACNAHPLLQIAASDYAPIRLGSRWDYKKPDGSVSVARQVLGAGPWMGKQAFTLQTKVNALPATLDHVAVEHGMMTLWDSTLGWTLWRQVPYVTGNKWDLATGNPNLTQIQFVDGTEKVAVPAGTFDSCFKLRTKTLTYSGGVTSTTQSYIWSAPGVGDVQYASEDVNGNVTVDLQLVGYSIP